MYAAIRHILRGGCFYGTVASNYWVVNGHRITGIKYSYHCKRHTGYIFRAGVAVPRQLPHPRWTKNGQKIAET